MAVFMVSGLWHGANWTFVLWGFLHGMYLVSSIITQNLRSSISHFLKIDRTPALKNLISIVITFHLVWLSWIFFRANSIGDAFSIIQQILLIDFSWATLSQINIEKLGWGEFIIAWFSIAFLLVIELAEINKRLEIIERSENLRLAFNYLLLFGVIFFGVYEHTEFIYFQF
jgi:hypothetical protein